MVIGGMEKNRAEKGYREYWSEGAILNRVVGIGLTKISEGSEGVNNESIWRNSIPSKCKNPEVRTC